MTKFRTLFLRSFTVTKSNTYRLYSQVLRHYRKLQQFMLECASVTLDGLVVGGPNSDHQNLQTSTRQTLIFGCIQNVWCSIKKLKGEMRCCDAFLLLQRVKTVRNLLIWITLLIHRYAGIYVSNLRPRKSFWSFTVNLTINLYPFSPHSFLFLGAFANLRKNEFQLRHVCLSVRIEQLGSQRKNFHEIWYLSILRKSVEKIQFWLKYDKNNGLLYLKTMYIYDHISLNSS